MSQGYEENTATRRLFVSLLLWITALAITAGYVFYENDPYDPIMGRTSFQNGPVVHYEFLRSKVIGQPLLIAVDAPSELSGYIRYRRVSSEDGWRTIEMEHRNVPAGGRHGKNDSSVRDNVASSRASPARSNSSSVNQAGNKNNSISNSNSVRRFAAYLPSLDKMAGKYAFTVHLQYGEEEVVIDDGRGNPIVSRYRGDIPAGILIPHIAFMILSMLFGLRAALEALRPRGRAVLLMWITMITLLIGGFVFGPLVQKYAFGVLWAGFPIGFDLTDNKVLIELILWLTAIYFNTGSRKNGRWSQTSIAVAGIITLIVYLIPHSLLGSSYDYTTGQGTGTAVQ